MRTDAEGRPVRSVRSVRSVPVTGGRATEGFVNKDWGKEVGLIHCELGRDPLKYVLCLSMFVSLVIFDIKRNVRFV